MAKRVKILRVKKNEFRLIVLGRQYSMVRPKAEKYEVGDVLFLREYEGGFTGGIALAEIIRVLDECEGLRGEWQLLSFDLVWSKRVD